MFITLEGTEGSGKTTQIKNIVECLRFWGVRHIKTREPGGTILGKKIRSILLDVSNKKIDPAAELLLCIADRIQHVRDVVKPGIDSGRVVVCDRYIDSSLAYQGFARGLDISKIWHLHEILCIDLIPDLTLIMDLEPSLSLSRAKKRIDSREKKESIRFELEDLSFHRKIRNGYLKLARSNPARFCIIDASHDENGVQKQIETVLKNLLIQHGYLNKKGI